MWSNDITYCANDECKRENCKRHCIHAPEGVPISVSYMSEGDGRDCRNYYPGGDVYVNVSFPMYSESDLYKRLEERAKQKQTSVENYVYDLLEQRFDRILEEALDNVE